MTRLDERLLALGGTIRAFRPTRRSSLIFRALKALLKKLWRFYS